MAASSSVTLAHGFGAHIGQHGQELGYGVFSPDGRQLALTLGTARGTNRHTDIYDFSRRAFTRFTAEGGGHAPMWSPDGTLLAYTMEGPKTNAEDIVVQPLDKSRPPMPTPPLPNDQHASAWPNDTTLVFSSNTATGSLGSNSNSGSTSIVNPMTASSVRPYLTANWGEVETSVSPDGQWAAFTSYETGVPEIHVHRFPGESEGGDWKVSTNGGRRSRWSADGRTIYYMSRDARSIRAVRVTPRPVFAVGDTSTVLSSARTLGSAWDLDRATGRILVTEPVTEGGARIVVVQHWLDSFAKRVSRGASTAK